MKRIVIVLVFLAAALAGTAPRAAADEITAEEVVARFVEAVGGREAIERIAVSYTHLTLPTKRIV